MGDRGVHDYATIKSLDETNALLHYSKMIVKMIVTTLVRSMSRQGMTTRQAWEAICGETPRSRSEKPIYGAWALVVAFVMAFFASLIRGPWYCRALEQESAEPHERRALVAVALAVKAACWNSLASLEFLGLPWKSSRAGRRRQAVGHGRSSRFEFLEATPSATAYVGDDTSMKDDEVVGLPQTGRSVVSADEI